MVAEDREPDGAAAWDEPLTRWKKLPTDNDAHFDQSVTIDASSLEPMITYGTNPGMAIPLTARVPAPSTAEDVQALRYMALEPGQLLLGHPIDVVFIGSCTNSRLSDLRSAARVLRGRKVNPGVRMLVVPGSYEVKRQAEADVAGFATLPLNARPAQKDNRRYVLQSS